MLKFHPVFGVPENWKYCKSFQGLQFIYCSAIHIRYTTIQAVTDFHDTSKAVPAKSLESCAYYCHHSECCIAFRFYEMQDRSCLTLSSPPPEADFKQEAPTYLEEGEVDNGILYSLIMYHCKPLSVIAQIYSCVRCKTDRVCTKTCLILTLKVHSFKTLEWWLENSKDSRNIKSSYWFKHLEAWIKDMSQSWSFGFQLHI